MLGSHSGSSADYLGVCRLFHETIQVRERWHSVRRDGDFIGQVRQCRPAPAILIGAHGDHPAKVPAQLRPALKTHCFNLLLLDADNEMDIQLPAAAQHVLNQRLCLQAARCIADSWYSSITR